MLSGAKYCSCRTGYGTNSPQVVAVTGCYGVRFRQRCRNPRRLTHRSRERPGPESRWYAPPMDMQRVFQKFEKTSGAWREVLSRRTDECFSKQRAHGQWTLGQACDHVTSVSLKFLEGAEALARGEGKEGRAALLPKFMIDVIGSLPPGRFKVPPNLPAEFAKFATPGPLTKEQATARFLEVERRHRELLDPVAAASPKICSKHPAAGWLNAGQWYKLSEMHMRHHLRQLRRIEKDLDA